MLEKIDLDLIFRTARKQGFLHSEIYAEVRVQSSLSLQGRIDDCRLATSGGIALRCHDGKFSRHFYTGSFSTEALVGLLDGQPSPSSEDDFTDCLPRPLREGGIDRTTPLIQAARSAFLQSGQIKNPYLQYEDTVKYFEVAQSSAQLSGGVEKTSELSARWSVERGERSVPFTFERCGRDPDALVKAVIDENILHLAVRKSLIPADPWPAPRGELPVLWSARALSKLHLLFLRAFEGDLVLGNLSFLTDLALPLCLPFRVEEQPAPGAESCDSEGSPRRAVTIFEEGRPKALACNRSVAEQLSVPSTGHGRRQTFQASPTVAFWNPRFVGHQTAESLSHWLERGLSVRDLEVLRFDPSTGATRLRLVDCALLHFGEEGEGVEPVEMDVDLLFLLRSLECFGTRSETIGLTVFKHNQKLITEICTPPAVSAAFPIPGTVPPGNYW